MKITVFGAGVIGSLYAGKLAIAGPDVALVARGKRLEELREKGIVLRNERTGQDERIGVRVARTLEEAGRADIVLVAVRKDQSAAVASELAGIPGDTLVVPMVNAADGQPAFRLAVPEAQLAFAFPGAGGARLDDGTILYTLVPGLVQATTVGPAGPASPVVTIKRLVGALRQAGFPAAYETSMDAWQKTHVALVSPIADALYCKSGDHRALASDRKAVSRMLDAVGEGFAALEAIGIPVRPARLSSVPGLPRWLSVPVLSAAIGSSWGETVIARHANSARTEMAMLSAELLYLVDRAGTPAPTLRALAGCAREIRPDYGSLA